MMFKYILSFSGLVALASSLALTNQTNQKGDDFPDIEAIMSKDPSTFKSYPASAIPRGNDSSSTAPETTGHWVCNTQAQLTWGDANVGEPGIFISNAEKDTSYMGYRGFYIYHNLCDAVPFKYIWVAGMSTRFVSLPPRFEGRVTRGIDAWNLGARGPQLRATWLEFSIDANGWIWTDISLIRGCDGGALSWATDGSGCWKGFHHPILNGAPADAYAQKNSGVWVLRESTNWDGTINMAVRDWEMANVGVDYVYVDDLHGNPVITSTNGQLGTYWPAGRP